MLKIKNIILTMALMGCSGLAFSQTVEQRIDSLQMLITADHPAPQGYSPKGCQGGDAILQASGPDSSRR